VTALAGLRLEQQPQRILERFSYVLLRHRHVVADCPVTDPRSVLEDRGHLRVVNAMTKALEAWLSQLEEV
jgi:hypothetical protein